jgi:hypothetical protein
MGNEAPRWNIVDTSTPVPEVVTPAPEVSTTERQAHRWNVPEGTTLASDNVYVGTTGPRGPAGPAGAPGLDVTQFGAVGDGATNDRPAIQAAMDSLGPEGGTVYFPPGTYAMDYSLGAPVNNTGWLVLFGYGATITWTDAASGGFLNMGYPVGYVAGDTFRRIIVEGFTFDCTALTGADNWMFNMNIQDASVEDWIIRDIRVDNFPSSQDSGGTLSFALSDNLATRTIKNILLDNIVADGGYNGFYIGGEDTDTEIDNVVVRNCRHDPGALFYNHTNVNFQLGGEASCGQLLVSGCYGRGAGDTGIEIDNWRNAVVEDSYVEDCWGAAFVVCAFAPALGHGEPTAHFIDCLATRTTETGASTYIGCGFTAWQFDDDTANLGNVTFTRCEYYRNTDTLVAQHYGDGIQVHRGAKKQLNVDSITVRDFKYTSIINDDAGAFGNHASMFFCTSGADITLSGLRFKNELTTTSEVVNSWELMETRGTLSDYHIDDVSIDADITIPVTSPIQFIQARQNTAGGVTPSTFGIFEMSNIRVFRWAGTNTIPRCTYVWVGNETFNSLSLRDSDFSRCSNDIVVMEAAGLEAVTEVSRVRYPVGAATQHPAITTARDEPEGALHDLLAALATLGLITDSSTAS